MKKKGISKEKVAKKRLAKKLLPALLATVYTVPCTVAQATEGQRVEDQGNTGRVAPKSVIVSQAISQEVIQLLQKEEELVFTIAGRPGVHFKVHYSATGEEGSYRLLPGGEGIIGENGMANLTLKLKELGLPVIYIKALTSDTVDFSREIRTMPEPLIIDLREPQIKVRGSRPGPVFRTPPIAVAGVRG